MTERRIRDDARQVIGAFLLSLPVWGFVFWALVFGEGKVQ